jgi:succinate-semialdehyde dehydrogenase / glutarate-semialdehyde dehydrogenase
MITRKMASALAIGCTVVVKPAPETPLTALALAEVARRADFPAGAINVITGNASAIGQVLTEDPRVCLVSLTGSTAVGKLLMGQASSTVRIVLLELGGNAPFIGFDDGDLDAAVWGAIQSKYQLADRLVSARIAFMCWREFTMPSSKNSKGESPCSSSAMVLAQALIRGR